MPRKAVAIYLILALLGAAIFIFCTFPRTKEEIPGSNNQRPFAEPPPSPNPGNVPVPEAPPHPTTPSPKPGGPTLRIMAWASAAEAQALSERLDAYAARTGWNASLTLVNDEATYRHDLAAALASDSSPDVFLVDARDFSGTDPSRDLADVSPDRVSANRSLCQAVFNLTIEAQPAEFSVDLLFYNPKLFSRAGIAAPGPHWNWDVMEAMARALGSLRMKTDAGETIYPLELPADFDFWNVLCTQAGHPALDSGTWHIGEAESRDAEMRSLDLIHEFFRDLSVTAPLPADHARPGRYFGQQRAAMLIGPSDLVASLPTFAYQITDLPRDMCAASLARLDGWAVASHSPQEREAQALAAFLARQPLHAGWTSVRTDAARDGFSQICQAALVASVIPRLSANDERLADFLDDQIEHLARHAGDDDTGRLYARIQAEYQSDFPKGGAKSTD